MGEPRIVNKEFLLVCLKYEFLKNDSCHAQAHRNLCEMMLAEDVREDVTREIDVSTPGSSVNSNWNSDSGNASQCSEEMPMAPPTNEPGPSNPKKRRVSQMCSVESQGFTHSNTRYTIDPVDSDGEDCDEDPESNLNFLMEDEGDPKINIIAFEVMRAIFDEFRRDMQKNDAKVVRMPIELSRLRREVYLHLKLYRPITFPMMDRSSGVFIPITAIESSLGSGSAKINLSHPSSFHKSQMQYLEDSKGTWIFYEDDARFLKNLHYTDLAANALIKSLHRMYEPLDYLIFDVDDKTKWSKYPNVNFYKKIKKWPRTPRFEFRIRRFYMKILKNHPKRDHPFKLRYLKCITLEDLTIRVWEDGSLGYADLTCLEDMKKNRTFREVKFLNIEDPNMREFEIIGTTYRTVKKWTCTQEEVQKRLALRSSLVMILNQNIWRSVKNKMEIKTTPEGCYCIPPLNFSISGLDPNTSYDLFLSFERISSKECRWFDGEWEEFGEDIPMAPLQQLKHPRSPRTGKEWIRDNILFEFLRVSNDPNDNSLDSLFLPTWQHFQPVITVSENPSGSNISFRFEGTNFYTVSEYMDPEVIKMKEKLSNSNLVHHLWFPGPSDDIL